MCTGRKQPRFRGYFGGTAWPIRGTASLNARTSTTGQGRAEINDGFASGPCTKVCMELRKFSGAVINSLRIAWCSCRIRGGGACGSPVGLFQCCRYVCSGTWVFTCEGCNDGRNAVIRRYFLHVNRIITGLRIIDPRYEWSIFSGPRIQTLLSGASLGRTIPQN